MLAASPSLYRLALLGGPAGAVAFRLLGELAGLHIRIDVSWETLAAMLLLAPLVEEFAFRGVVQSYLAPLFGRKARAGRFFVTPQNMATSVLFAACHLVSHPAPAALLTVVPSLFFGHLRDGSNSVRPCVYAHAWFNACYLAVFAA